MIGSSASPFSVRAYSTRGGTSAYVVRRTIPSSSSARRRSDRVRGLIPASERSSSQKRELPSERSRTSRSVHLPQTMSAVAQTGQLGSIAPHFTWWSPGASGGGAGVRHVVHRRPAATVRRQQQLEVVRARRGADGLLDAD